VRGTNVVQTLWTTVIQVVVLTSGGVGENERKVSMRGILVPRLLALITLFVVFLSTPARGFMGCMECEWCDAGEEWVACCLSVGSGGYSSCLADYNEEEGWFCHVGSPCE
jgi:hypothetical protein